jgi:hypothetical protein
VTPQKPIWVEASELAGEGYVFYRRLNDFVGRCADVDGDAR